MSPTENPEGLLAATRQLHTQVEQLGRNVRVHQGQAHRTRVLTIATLVLTVMCLVGLGISVRLYGDVQDAVRVNRHTQVVSCENSNELRKANIKLWTQVLNLSAASNPNQTAEQKKLSREFLAWVTELYAARDCSNLSAKVDIPPPPKFVR